MQGLMPDKASCDATEKIGASGVLDSGSLFAQRRLSATNMDSMDALRSSPT